MLSQEELASGAVRSFLVFAISYAITRSPFIGMYMDLWNLLRLTITWAILILIPMPWFWKNDKFVQFCVAGFTLFLWIFVITNSIPFNLGMMIACFIITYGSMIFVGILNYHVPPEVMHITQMTIAACELVAPKGMHTTFIRIYLYFCLPSARFGDRFFYHYILLGHAYACMMMYSEVRESKINLLKL